MWTAALKAQLRFRQYALLQDAGSRSVFNFTKQGNSNNSRTPLTVEELVNNVKLLVTGAVRRADSGQGAVSILVGKTVRRRFRVDGAGDKWFQGEVIFSGDEMF